MTESASPTPDDEQPTGTFEPVGEPAPADPELPPPGAPSDGAGSGDLIAQIEKLAQNKPEALIAGAFAVGFTLAMVVRRLVR